MAGIYITNIEMPTGNWYLVINSHGDVECYNHFPSQNVIPWDIVRDATIPVPDHGRLADVDEICDRLLALWDTADKEKKTLIIGVLSEIVVPIIAGTPTIIPADKDGAE